MAEPARIAILDDHQAIIDGYLYRISGAIDLKVVATLNYGEELEPLLAQQAVDVLILDVQVPTSPTRPTPYPLLFLIPKLLERYPSMVILVITMHSQPAMARAVMEAGASGFILKDDRTAILELPAIIRLVWGGGIYLSQQVSQRLRPRTDEAEALLTPRQLEILSYCAAYPESNTARIAQAFNIAHSTVRDLLSGAYLRLDVPNRYAAIAKARQMGLIPPEEPPIA